MRLGSKLMAVGIAAAAASCAELPRYTAPGTLAYADQGWTASQRSWFYHTSQGTKIMPYAWFMALEQPQLSLTGAPLFADPAYLARFGFLPDAASPANPDALPVGFAKGESFVENTTQLEPVVGLTCAACHTGQIEYRGRGLRVDGGPALIDSAALQAQIGAALFLTDGSEPRFSRFATRVLGPLAPASDRDALKARLHRALGAGLQEQDLATRDRLYPVAEGAGRLDALGRGANFVFGILAGDDRNLVPAGAPVSFPALWDAPWFDWVQYNGAIRQPMGRNVAEAMGVRSVTRLSGPPENLYLSTVAIGNIAQMEAQLAGPQPGAGLRAPRWPEDLLGPIDRAKAARGREHFARLCAGCHEGGWSEADQYGRRYRQLEMVSLDQIGTDRTAAANFVARRAYPSLTAQTPIPAVEGLKTVTDRVIQRWYDDNHIPPEQRVVMDGYRPNEWRALSAYKARPLEGVWATGPYLHNGSVPSLYQMLLPAEQRQPVFYAGAREFDPVQVGFRTEPFSGAFKFDTTLSGNSNRGHEFRAGSRGAGVIGPELTDAQRWEIVEYLKSL